MIKTKVLYIIICILGLICINQPCEARINSDRINSDSIVQRATDSDYEEIYSRKFSAVNPSLFGYTPEDVYINNPQKYNNGANIIRPDINKYPWEARLENGMPNVIVSEYGDVSIYLSSFIAFANRPPSKVGALVYTNNTASYTNWTRPDAGLYWYNANGLTSDDKITDSPNGQAIPTNIVATDIESLGMYDQYDKSKNGIDLIYLPQRESYNHIILAYQMNKTFDSQGILSGFKNMRTDRQRKQINFYFDFINGDTHMGILKEESNYSFVSRVNAKRSYITSQEHLPLKPDTRKRYRRETITPIGYNFVSQHVTLNVALDMSTPQWEPYSMQPFQMAGFEDDVWYGLVTMFGTEGDPDVAAKQRTELAISNDGFHWRYLKPGYPFLNNGTDPNSDDYGCINIAIPVNNTAFSSDRNDLYYFYAASNQRHISGRNPGISLAFGKRGMWAGLKANSTVKKLSSPINDESETIKACPYFSLYNAFFLGTQCAPLILSTVTEDPTGKNINSMNSYVAVLMYALDGKEKGSLLTAVLGKPQKNNSSIPSDDYEIAPFISGGKDASSKYYLMKFFCDLSKDDPFRIISLKNLEEIPVVFETQLKNSTFYGLKYKMTKAEAKCPLNVELSSLHQPKNIWIHEQSTAGQHYTKDFSKTILGPNETTPVNMVTGTIAIEATVGSVNEEQVLINVYGDANNNNNLNVVYDSNGNFVYTLNKDGMPFAQMVIAPPKGTSFDGRKVSITVESLHPRNRKYGSDIVEQVTTFRVSCPSLDFEKIIPQPIIWNWKHEEGQITESDKANAQCFAFLEFTSFIPEMTKLSIGSKDTSGSSRFNGTIHKVQFAPILPNGPSDFWE